ncbi:MAG: hypothetical protein U9O98_06885 [Asgard group archaeon]|nr:hypothetical protein [Asgard group archaeon]
MLKSKITKMTGFSLVLFVCLPFFMTLSTAYFSSGNYPPYTISDEDKTYRMLLYKKGELDYNNGLGDIDSFTMDLKKDKEYVFWTKIKISSGVFTLAISGSGGSAGDTETFDTDDPDSVRKLTFKFTPSESGEYSLAITSFLPNEGGTYRLYANRSGFAGWWWMALSGVGAIIIVVLIIVGVIRIFRGPKRKRRR